MLTISQSKSTSRARRLLARLHRPLLDLQNPVRRYLGDRALGRRHQA